MQRLINAIDKATRAGAYTLEETANILQAIDQVGGIVAEHNKLEKAKKEQKEAEEQRALDLAKFKAEEDAKLKKGLEKA